MNILYTGWYGYHNAGDDSFVYVTDWMLKEKFPHDKVRCLSPQQYGNGVESVFLSKKMSFKFLILSLLWYIPQTDVLLFSGGSLFRGEYKNNLYLRIVSFLCKIWRLRISAVGVSIGPFAESKSVSDWDDFFTKMDLICLRDSSSYKWSLNRGYKNCFNSFDIACLLPKYMSNKGYTSDIVKENAIGISLCSFAKEPMQSNILNSLQNFFKNEKRCKSVYLFVYKSGEGGDEKISYDFCSYLTSIGYKSYLIDYDSPFTTIQEMKKCKLMICSRLHAGIFSYAFNMPFMMFEYEPKCTDFLTEICKEEDCRIKDITVDNVENTYRVVLNKNENLRSITEMQLKAEEGFILLQRMIGN